MLRKDGTCWLNYGDAYAATRDCQVTDNKHNGVGNTEGSRITDGLMPKDLMMIPARVCPGAPSGWLVGPRRNNLAQDKPDAGRASRDRPTSAHEKMYLLSKSARYFYDAEAGRGFLTTGRPTQARKDGQNKPNKGSDPNNRWANYKTPDGWDTGLAVMDPFTGEGVRKAKVRGHERIHEGFRDKWDDMPKEEQQAIRSQPPERLDHSHPRHTARATSPPSRPSWSSPASRPGQASGGCVSSAGGLGCGKWSRLCGPALMRSVSVLMFQNSNEF